MRIPFDSIEFRSSLLDSLLVFSDSYTYYCIYNSNSSADNYEILAGFGAGRKIEELNGLAERKAWCFGYCSYDVKNEFEKLYSVNSDVIKAPEINFFEPEVIVSIRENTLEIIAETPEKEAEVLKTLKTLELNLSVESRGVNVKQVTDKKTYIDNVNKIKERISVGDIYEMNYCMNFIAEGVQINPVTSYKKLNKISEAPFSALCRFNDIYVISSSPERFIKKSGNILLTQPVKGTAPRSVDSIEDKQTAIALQNDAKEQNENVMIVDVARNDLSRIARRGSVAVKELFGVYPFKQVHQMISTVVCEVEEKIEPAKLLGAIFPPASMTGAPKIKAMQVIEETESFKRGIYSGVLGYISPGNDMDFNVVIRTILYNASEGSLSYAVGSAITDMCIPEKEYEECLLKAKAMTEILV